MADRINLPLSELPIAAFKNRSEITKFDKNYDGALNVDEAMEAYAAKKGGKEFGNIKDVFEVYGGARHELDVYVSPRYGWELDRGYHKANFVAGRLGRGECVTYHTQPEVVPPGPKTMVFGFKFDDKAPMGDIESATLLLAPNGFPDVGGLADVVPAPLDVIAEEPRWVPSSCGSGGYNVPGRKALVVSLDHKHLKALSDASVDPNQKGVAFYVKLQLRGAKDPIYIKALDGDHQDRSGNFLLKANEEFEQHVDP
jgi:hypothetical protein